MVWLVYGVIHEHCWLNELNSIALIQYAFTTAAEMDTSLVLLITFINAILIYFWSRCYSKS